MLIMFMMADSLRLTGSRSLYVHLVPIIAMVLTAGEPQMGRLVGPVIISQVSFSHLFLGTMSEEDERLRYCCCALAERGIFHGLLVPLLVPKFTYLFPKNSPRRAGRESWKPGGVNHLPCPGQVPSLF